jgi:fibronectin-binding autotransporter adhesin
MTMSVRPSGAAARALKTLRLAAFTLGLLAAQLHVARADTTAFWSNPVSGVWASTTKWSTDPNYPHNGKPTGVDYTAVINVAGTSTYTITLNSSPITIDGLTIDSAQAILEQIGGSFTPGPVNIDAGIFEISDSAASVNDSAIDVGPIDTTVGPQATLELYAGSINGGSVLANGLGSYVQLDAGFTFTGGATVTAENGAQVTLQNGTFINNSTLPTIEAGGILAIGTGATLDNTGTTAGSSSTLQPAAGTTIQLQGGTISGGTVNSTGGTLLNYATGTLDGTPTGGITLIGAMQQIGFSTTYLNGLVNDPDGFTFEEASSNVYGYNILLTGNTELSGSGSTTTISGGPSQPVALGGFGGTEQLTIDAGHTLLSNADVTSGGHFKLINNGTIQSDGDESSFDLAVSFGSSNTGTIEATNGGSLTLDSTAGGTLNNSGSLLADGTGSFLAISGTGITNTGTGSIQATNGGTVELQNGDFTNNGLVTVGANSTFSVGTGAILDNTGTTAGSSNTLQSSAGGTIQINNGGTISGGTVNSSGGTFQNVSYGTLDGTPAGGITLIGTLAHNDSAETYLQGLINDPDGFTFDTETQFFSPVPYYLLLSGNTELSGNGSTTTIANSSGGYVYFGTNNEPQQLTIDAGHTLLTHADVQNSGAMTLINNGTIQADGSFAYFPLQLGSGSSNSGLIESTNGADVQLDTSFGSLTNTGTLLADGTGSLLALLGSGITNSGPGTIQATNGGTVELRQGTFVNDGLVTAGPGSTFSIASQAIFDNTGTTAGSASLLQASPGGTLQLNQGTISGGTVNSTGGEFLSLAGTLDGMPAGGITLIGKMLVNPYLSAFGIYTELQGLINDPDGFTFDVDPASTSGENYILYLAGNTELSGTGSTTTLANSGGGTVSFFNFIACDLTIDSGHTLLSQANVLAQGINLINNGTIQADGSGHSFNLFAAGDGANSNTGTIEATNGGSVTLAPNGGTFTNSGTITANGPGSYLGIGGGFSNIATGTIGVTNGATLEFLYGNFINNGLATAAPGCTLSIGDGAVFDNTGTTPGSSSTLAPPLGGILQLNGGTISGGTVTSAGGTFLSNSGVLDGTETGGITLLGTLLHTNGAYTLLQGLINDPNGFTFDSAPSAGAGGSYHIALNGDTELSGVNSTTTLANSNGGPIFFGGAGDVTDPTLTIDSGHTLLSKANVQSIPALGYGSGPFTLTNNGTLQADGASNQIYLGLAGDSVNTGLIAATHGAVVTLDNSAGDTFTNDGILRASGGGTLAFVSANLINTGTIALHNGILNTDVALAVGDGTLTGSGVINGDVTLSSDPSTLTFQIRSATDYDSLNINGHVTLAGNLEVTLCPGANITGSDVFDLLNATSLSGSFLDVSDGGRLLTTCGNGSFQVNYGSGDDADEVVLSNFQAIPEPACLSLLLLTGTGFMARRRTRR